MKEYSYILNKICSFIVLSDSAKEAIKTHYLAISKLLANSNLIDCPTNIKPQGSYNLGTAIRPLNGSDDYDIDLVVILMYKYQPQYVKESIGKIIEESKTYHNKLLPEKRRAWTIEYANSHVDVVPAIAGKFSDDNSDILITDKSDENIYTFLESSPFKFKDWFEKKGMGIYQENTIEKRSTFSKIEQPKEYNQYTILQKVVQLLKFHRNKMFEDRDQEIKPISMVITILAGKAYRGQKDLSIALLEVVNNLRSQMDYDLYGTPHIFNPINHEEDFADKWNDHPERKKAFFEWLDTLEKDFGTIEKQSRLEFSNTLSQIFGTDRIKNAYNALGRINQQLQKEGQVSINHDGVFEGGTNDKTARPHTFWGDCKKKPSN
ncbi:nucleotidyltransferase (plasmid) [Limosilactobacillus mucosae]|uniref:Nucleotidyltransferase n=3 Tax=Bacteria TaxID=2 RepID=A0A0R1NVT6_LIMMU|nr:nucleotidyltransferase [Limosilactobacillus mucosae]KRL24295.1 hypothetical protein FC47_GL000836 [Limosilactobacillus mucosae DSM 13345]QOL68808.1 nucleotidyltransferase [Limosilactobacillus mucosae]